MLNPTVEEEIDQTANHKKLLGIEDSIRDARDKHNTYLKELGLAELK